MASHKLIDGYLADLARRLPPDTVDELADGLAETWRHHLATGLDATDAAQAAIAEFGTGEQVIAAFVAHAPGRRTALTLLASGPIVGACWAAGLVAGDAWSWPVPTATRIGFGLGLLGVVTALAVAATSRRSYRRTRLGALGALGLLALDAAMVTVAVLVAPALVWPMAVAIPASLGRIGLTARSLRASLAR